MERAVQPEIPAAPEELKAQVKDHWEAESCGARNGGDTADRREFFARIEETRYQQDYMIKQFADFPSAKGLKILEVGLGTGSDFMNWCRAGAVAFGRDLTQAAVNYVKERLELEGMKADVATGDAEKLEFPDETFDIYYSWGVLHHTADPSKAFREAHRVLKPGGKLKIMLYHYRSVATFLIWLLYGPLKLNWKSSRELVFHNVESVGTRVYTEEEVRAEFGQYFDPKTIKVRTYLGAGDLLNHTPSAKYQSALWKLIIALYPAWFVKLLGHRYGSVMTVEAVKS